MSSRHSVRVLQGALLLAAALAGVASAGEALDRIRDRGRITLAYLPNAKPFTYEAGGAGAGYGAALCAQIAAAVKSRLGLPQLETAWVAVRMDNAFSAVAAGQADVLCTPSNATLERRKTLSFSIPVFAGGVRAVVRSDAPAELRNILEAAPVQRNVWRGSPALSLLEKTTFATTADTSTERRLAGKIAGLKLNTATVSVPDYASGIKFLLERKIDVFLAERDAVLAAMDDTSRNKLLILNRQLTHDPLALALPRNDEDFRLVVDTALSAAYGSPEFAALYGKYFGSLDEASRTFFSWATPAP
jgi:polar amino acid transport system substrate-binding protein